jgi:hypothetical protein
VFHSPQASQRPCHFGWLAPQAWQTKRVLSRAMSGGVADGAAPVNALVMGVADHAGMAVLPIASGPVLRRHALAAGVPGAVALRARAGAAAA